MPTYTHVSLAIQTAIETWETLEERPTGSRAKVTVSDPASNRLCIFKHPKAGREHQLWSELVGSYIAGDLLGWEVQHTSLGLRNGNPGNLLRYMFDPDVGEQLIEGWKSCLEIDPAFDTDKGERHTLPLLEDVYWEVIRPRYHISEEDFFGYWARALAFDALISNTDRHGENWGIIVGANGARMAPLYDNASSLGCGLDYTALQRFFDSAGHLIPCHMEKFRERGRHHLRISEPGRYGGPFEETCIAFLGGNPTFLNVFAAVAEVDLRPVESVLAELTRSGIPVSTPWDFAARRVTHMYASLQIGQERIKNILHALSNR